MTRCQYNLWVKSKWKWKRFYAKKF